ncbi:MAG: peptidoglycan DD-metalloendopeptidase family protein [Gammaproteobacteria bacterium]|nr:peptidoglycan DD-metalloendopeptidase family protein [Gammaproteobacteria bacterium]
MAYKSYIKKDYKTRDGRKAVQQPLIAKHHFPYVFVAVSMLASVIFFGASSLRSPTSVMLAEDSPPAVSPVPIEENTQAEATLSEILEPSEVTGAEEFHEDSTEQLVFPEENIVEEENETLLVEELVEEPYWESVKVESGDNLALIFKRKRLSAKMLYNIMALGEDTAILKHLKPGQEIRFLFEDGQFEALQYDVDLTDTLYIKKLGDIYSAEKLETALETKVKTTSGTINDSLFLAGKRSSLSDNMIMQMINLYGWDIDFALEVRQGDQFHMIYEERYKNNEKVQDGPILAAEFINRGKSFKSVRYKHADGHSDYYAENGNSMRKAFLRTPVKFARISSRFNLGRKHPILNRIRAHKGVDYAASTGTPVRSAGDGVVKLAARKGGYGKAIIIQHGGKYTTLYGHLSRYARAAKRGKHVKQGQIIGYVGMTGLATGPHLHYEFRVNGVHRNPLTVKLPKAMRIPDDLMDEFKTQTEPLLAQLNGIASKTTVAAGDDQVQAMIALNEKGQSSSPPN